MLNISNNSISDRIQLSDFRSHKLLKKTRIKRPILSILGALMVLGIACLFLPWTQNIGAKGYITTRGPEQRPQAIQSVISGRLDKWYVQEGDYVKAGDTIVYLSEVKSDYFDTALIARTNEQLQAKEQSIHAYNEKIAAIEQQYYSLKSLQVLKQQQLNNKILQAKNKIAIDSVDLIAIEASLSIAENQYERVNNLYKEGLKSLSDLQKTDLKRQEMIAKRQSQFNKLLNQKNTLQNLVIELTTIQQEYSNKLSKSLSDKQSAITAKLESVGSVAKLQNMISNYTKRQTFYYVTAPQEGFIVKATKKGIGEYIKEGAEIVTVMPANRELAVEIYLKPQDVPLVQPGDKVQLRFDGWPAIVISGWPKSSTGVFTGQVVAMDQNISENGHYRILITNKLGSKQWPDELKVGTGTRAFVLLNDVPIWYEMWRQLNGFPYDYYQKEHKKKDPLKRKAPLKSVK